DWDDSTQFSYVTGMALGPDGSAYVADMQAGVLVWPATEVTPFKVGQPGAGPGDIMMPCCLDVGADGQLWGSDLANRRYSIFDVIQAVVTFRAVIPSGGAGVMSTDRLLRRDHGGVYHLSTVQGGPSTGSIVVMALDSTGAIDRADTLVMPLVTPDVIELKMEVNGGVSSNRIAVPFGAVPLFAFGGEFQVRATSSQYRVEIVPSDGGAATIIERQVAG